MKSNEEKYKKLTHREHVLLRPDTYIGSTNTDIKNIFVADQIEDIKNSKIVLGRVNYNPGFIKLFDEIISNASDHSIRTGLVKNIKVNVSDDHITIENDGPGIPVEMHKDHKIYIPELIFSHLLTGENFDDSEERYVGGKNGMGSVLVNIYSNRFIVETADGKNKFKQEYYNNNSKKKKFSKRSYKSKQYTKITYYPDFSRFDNIESITEEIQRIFLKRTIDVATYCPKVKVYYNGTVVPMKSFKDYMGMFIEDKKEIFTERLNDKWEIGVTKSLTDNFMQNSMVNGVSTLIGGTHVDLITNKIVKEIKENLEKKYKKTTIKPTDIKSRLFLFVNCQVSQPEFDTQTKENLITKLKDKVEPSQNLIKKILSSSILEEIIDLILLKEQQAAKRKLRGEKVKRLKVAKLQDAIKAGTSESEKCALFLTEGDCLEENTHVTIIRNEKKINIPIKDVVIDDVVITHKHNLGLITNISKKIEKAVKIKFKDDYLICSENHRWLCYNKINNSFEFIKTKNLNINQHKLIINRNAFFENFEKIKNIEKINHKTYDYLITSESNEFYSSKNHKFSIFDKNYFKFKMVKCKDLNIENHLLVSYNKL